MSSDKEKQNNKEEQDLAQEEVSLDEQTNLQEEDGAYEELAEEKAEETAQEKLERERLEYLQGWQRAQAELKNLMRRHEEEKKLFTTLGKESLVQELIPVLDNFNAAFANKEVWEQVDENWRRGIEYIHSQFLASLEANGVSAYGEVGDAFDTQLHEPLESAGEGEKVVEVVQKGYKIGDRVVRPAKVKLG